MAVDRTDGEKAYVAAIRDRMLRARVYLDRQSVPDAGAGSSDWFTYLADLSAILGDSSNSIRFVATLMAKAYLTARLPLCDSFDVAKKAMGASGLGIDEQTRSGERVIGELKTAVPFGKNDLGAAQKKAFAADFTKLVREAAEHKCFFVTDSRTCALLKRKYARRIPGVRVVLLGSDQEYVFVARENGDVDITSPA